jgi:MFS family permease
MLKILFKYLVIRRHYWRHVGFDELSELYISMMFRTLAISLTGIFVPIYLWDLNYSFLQILSFFLYYFAGRVVFDVASGFTVAKIGPKHSIAFSYVLQIIALGMLIGLSGGAYPLWLIALFWGSASSLFFTAYHVDFSKIKHSDHGGKEIGFMMMMQRVGGLLGPLVGGLMATFFGPQYAFLAAIVFFSAGALPLFVTAEPVRTRQKINFRDLPVSRLKRDFIVYTSVGIEHSVAIQMWPLYVGVFLISGGVYAKIGVLASLGAIIALLTAYFLGKTIDKHQGRLALRVSAVMSSILSFIRPFVGSYLPAIGVNMASEATAAGVHMPFQKGLYDTADSLTGNRIVYISSLEAVSSAVKATLYGCLIVLSGYFSIQTVFAVSFFVAGVFSLLILMERFDALNSRRA